MKDFFILLTLFIVLFIAFVPVTGLAENSTYFDKKDAQDSISVYGKYVENSEGIIYSININWGDMLFTYTEPSKGTWNPQTHDYDNPITGGWSSNGNIIEITNHSNVDVTITLSYSSKTELDITPTATFSNEYFTLKTAEGTSVDNAPSKSVSLELSGEIDKNIVDNQEIGSISIKIS